MMRLYKKLILTDIGALDEYQAREALRTILDGEYIPLSSWLFILEQASKIQLGVEYAKRKR